MLEVGGEFLEQPTGSKSRKRVLDSPAECHDKISLTYASDVASIDMSRNYVKAGSKHPGSSNSGCELVANTVSQQPVPIASPVGWNAGVQGVLRISFGSKIASSAIMRSHCGWDECKIHDMKEVASPHAVLRRDPFSMANFSSNDNIRSTEHEVSDCNCQSTFNNVPFELAHQSYSWSISRDSPVLENLSQHHREGSNANDMSKPLRRNGPTLSEFPGKPIPQMMDGTITSNAKAIRIRQLQMDTVSQASISKANIPETLPPISTENPELARQEVSVVVDDSNKQGGLWKREKPPGNSSQFTCLNNQSSPKYSRELKDLSDVDERRSTMSVDRGRVDVQFEEHQISKVSTVNDISTYSSTGITETPESSASDAEAFLQKKYFPPQNNTAQVYYCLACASRHHRTWNCSALSCVLCGDGANHLNSSCPLGQRCGKCRELGHLTAGCQEKLSRAKGERVPCDLCSSLKHVESGCDQIWRSFLPQPEEINTINELSIHCYSCGASGHFGPECGLHTGPLLSGPRTWTQENYLKYVELRSRYLALPILYDATNYRHAQRSVNIRGKAGDLSANRGEVNDDDRLVHCKDDTTTSQINRAAFKVGFEQTCGSNPLLDPRNYQPRKLPVRAESCDTTIPNFGSSTSYSPPFRHPAVNHPVDQVMETNLGTHPLSIAQPGDRSGEQSPATSAFSRLAEASLAFDSNSLERDGFSGNIEERKGGAGAASRRGRSRRGKSKRLKRSA